MSQNGFVKFDRKIKDWGWYTDVNTFKLFFHLITFAQFADSEFLGVKIKRGQIARSYARLAKETGLTQQELRTAINHLKATNEITSQATRHFTVFTVNNYDRYQTNQHTEQHTSNTRKQTKTAINHLKATNEATNEITSQATRQFTVSTVNNCDKYQTNQHTNQHANQHLSNTQSTQNQHNNKNNKNNKKEKNIETALSGEDEKDVFESRMF